MSFQKDSNKKRDDGHKINFEHELRKIVSNVKSNYDPEKIILFGSSTKGYLTDEGDIDLIIIKTTKDDPWKRAAQVDSFIDHVVPVDLLIYTPEEIESRLKINDFLVKDILENGIVLYEKGV
ncbi:MAG: nucleotidyltransferase domain-containing protein [Thermodesulfobacteriota bacterium]|nr:nucleotidyltransferase domain-containing protein [Thermodesulfobacteriota bacterium]